MFRSGFVIGFFLLCSIITSKGQDAPITSITSVSNALPNQQVTIRAFVKKFTNIGSASLYLDYDYSVLRFVSAAISPQLAAAGNYAIGDNDLGNGNHRVIMGWYGNGASLPDSTGILTVVFTYLTGSTSLNWFDNGPSCAFTNAAAIFLNDAPSGKFYKPGKICGNIQDQGFISGRNSVPAGTKGEIYSVTSIPGAKDYIWSLPPGAAITSGLNSNQITVDFNDTAVNGEISVRGINDCNVGPLSVMPVTIVNTPTGINEKMINYGESNNGSGSLELFPNPANEKFTLRLRNIPNRNIRLFITSVTGVQVKNSELEIPDVSCEQDIDVSDLSSGLYFVMIKSGGKKFLGKLVIQ